MTIHVTVMTCLPTISDGGSRSDFIYRTSHREMSLNIQFYFNFINLIGTIKINENDGVLHPLIRRKPFAATRLSVSASHF
jgi:hypothetical protein